MTATLRPGAWLLIAGAFTVLWFSGLDARRLHHPDEGRYAEIAREMQASGDWVTPRLNGLKYFEKPPLQYWVTAAAFAVFGTHDWTARLPGALFGWLAVFAIGYAGTRIGGPAVGLFGAAVQAGSVWPAGIGHFVSLDAVLSGFLALALAAFLVAQGDTAEPVSRRRWMIAAWLAVAGAVLTKGPVGLVIPAGALLLHALVTRDVSLWRRLELVRGAAVLLLVVAPWFVLVALRNPEFAHFFFIHEHVERFLTTEHQREGAWWYFVPLLLLGALPWTALLAGLPSAAARSPRSANGFAWITFCLCWSAFVFVFFSVSGSKLPSYILPLFPALALVLGWQVSRMRDRAWRRLVVLLAAATVILAAALWWGYDDLARRLATERTPQALYLAFGHGVKVGMSIIAAGMTVAWALDRGRLLHGRALAVVAIALALDAGLEQAFWANDGLSETRSTAGLVAALRADPPGYDAAAPFYQVRLYDQTLPWYLGRTTTVVDYRDELALGLDAEPGKGLPTTAEWMDRWRAGLHGYALMAPDTHAALAAAGVPMRTVAANARYVLVARA